jgi:hypothetical protein
MAEPAGSRIGDESAGRRLHSIWHRSALAEDEMALPADINNAGAVVGTPGA